MGFPNASANLPCAPNHSVWQVPLLSPLGPHVPKPAWKKNRVSFNMLQWRVTLARATLSFGLPSPGVTRFLQENTGILWTSVVCRIRQATAACVGVRWGMTF